MTKVAALAPTLLASLGMAAAATAIDAYGQRQVRKDQERANAAWLDYQRRNKARFEGMEESERANAEAAFRENLAMQDQGSREGIIDTEATRLEDIYGGGLDDLSRDVLASGQDPGRSEVFDTAMASSLAEATAEARKRMQGLAKASAYGGGTQFGQGQVLGGALQEAGTDIGFANTNRMGNTGTLQRYQTVQPEMFEYKQSPLVPLLQAGSMIVGGMDPTKFGAMFGTPIPAGAPTTALTGSAWTGVPRPQPRPAQFSFMPATSAFYPQSTAI